MIHPHQDTNRSARNEYEAMQQINGGITKQDEEFAEYEKMLGRRIKQPSPFSCAVTDLIVVLILIGVISYVCFFGRI